MATFLRFTLQPKAQSMKWQNHARCWGRQGHTGTEPTQACPVLLWNICLVGYPAAWSALQIGPLWQKCPCGTVTSSLESGRDPHILIVTHWTQMYPTVLVAEPFIIIFWSTSSILLTYRKTLTPGGKLCSYLDHQQIKPSTYCCLLISVCAELILDFQTLPYGVCSLISRMSALSLRFWGSLTQHCTHGNPLEPAAHIDLQPRTAEI